jgi:L-aspartate oxidase
LSQTNINNQYDVLVVGAGAAGLYTALCLPESLQIGLITKETISLSASDWAQGGIAAAVAPEDSPKLHVEDTLKAGAGLCEREAVQFLAEHAPNCIQSLVNLGVAFDRHNSQLALTLEAAHSQNRVLHAADTTGREVITTLTAQVFRRQNIQVIQQALALNLWLDHENNQCQGISLFYQGQIQWIRAGTVVLATGGGGQVFAQTTNPGVSTGDGVAIASRAGAILRDLEFVQFHPTALTKPGADRFLISEAVRGEGAHLVDDVGNRFAFEYHPDGELAPRDIVSRAIFSHLQRTAADPTTAHVWLDMRPIPPNKIRHRFPNIIKVCKHWGIDVFTEKIPVAPAAHYWMGGIVTDLLNRTNIPGLYAVGETASTGVHGANRLASNSLLECIVFGAQMAKLKVEELRIKDEVRESDLIFHMGETLPVAHSFPGTTSLQVCVASKRETPGVNCLREEGVGGEDMGSLQNTTDSSLVLSELELQNLQTELEAIRQKIPRLVWQHAGISRQQQGLDEAIATIKLWQQDFAELPFTQFLLSLSPQQSVSFQIPDIERLMRLWAETHNLLDVAYLIFKSAVFRTESRGGHYRLDYPQPDPNWQIHTLVQKEQWWTSSVTNSGKK